MEIIELFTKNIDGHPPTRSVKLLWQNTVADCSASPADETHHCFPCLTRLRSGALALVHRVGSSKESADGRLRIQFSPDNGRTWRRCGPDRGGPIRGAPAEWRTGGIAECANGDWLFSFSWFDRTNPTLPMFNPVTEGLLPVELCVARSRNSGESFSPPSALDVTPKIQPAITGPALLLDDGMLLQGFETNKVYDDPGPWRHQSCVMRSADHGLTWERPIVIAEDPSGRLMFFDQRLARLADNRIVACFWTYDRQKRIEVPIHITVSEDGGRSWSPPRSTGREGQIGSPVALADGRLALVWVRRHPPPSIRLAVSKDLQSWGEEFTVYDHTAANIGGADGKQETGEYLQAMQLWNFGVPGGVGLPTGNCLLTCYAPGMRGTRIVMTEVAP